MDEIREALRTMACLECNVPPGAQCRAFEGTPEETSLGVDAVHVRRLSAWRKVHPEVTPLSQQVRAFHEKFGHAVGGKPALPDVDVLAFRLRLITEKYVELLHAAGCQTYDVTVKAMQMIDQMVGRARKSPTNYRQVLTSLPDIIDALGDLDYVIEGTRLVCGVNGAPIAEEIQRANMSKTAVGDLKKPTKPAGWQPPDIEGELVRQGWKRD